MSAITAFPVRGIPGYGRRSVDPAADRPGHHDGRAVRRLTSVPTGDAVHTRLRVTRRGRATLTLAAVAAALTVGLGQAVAGPAPEPLRSVTVEPGETLSQIARAELPGLAVDDAVVALQAENGLATPFVHAGQELSIPSR